MRLAGTILVSAAGTHVYFWDITANKLMQKFSLHQKTITSLTISSAPESKFLLISGSLDGSVKVRLGFCLNFNVLNLHMKYRVFFVADF